MAEELIYRISFQGLDEQTKAIGQLDAEISGLNATVKAQRDTVKELEKANQQGTARYQELEQAVGENIVKARELTKQKSDLIRETQNEAKVNQKAEGSIDALRAQLSILTKEYNSLGKQQRETGKGKEVQTQARAISDELKALEGAIGDNRRNVGNYGSALDSALKTGLIPFGSEINDLKNKFQQGKDALAAFTGAQKASTAATGVASKGLKLFRVALISTGIGAIVVALGSLVAAFLSTQEGIDIVNRALRPFTVAFQKVIGLFQGAALKAFRQPKEALKDLGDFIVGQFTNRIKALRNIISGVGDAFIAVASLDFSAAGDALAGVGSNFVDLQTGVEGTIKKVGAFADESEKAADNISNLDEKVFELTKRNTTLIASYDAEIERLKAIAADTSKTAAERAKAGNEAIATIEKRKEAELELLEAEILLLQARQKLNDTDREGQLELEALIAKRDEFERAASAGAKEVTGQVNAAYQAQAASLAAVNKQIKDLRDANTLASIKDVAERSRLELKLQNEANLASVELLKVSEKKKQELRDEFNEAYKIATDKLNEEIFNATEATNAELIKRLDELAIEQIENEQQKQLKLLEIAKAAREEEIKAQLKLLAAKEVLSGSELVQQALLQDLLLAETKAFEKQKETITKTSQDRELLAAKELGLLKAETLGQQKKAELELIAERQRQELALFQGGEEERNLLVEKFAQERAEIEARYDEAADQQMQERMGKINAAFSQASSLLSGLAELQNTITQAQLIDLDNRYAAQLANVEKGSEAEKAILQKKTAEENKLQKKAFENNKALQIAQTIVATAQGALQAFASAQVFPPPLSSILGGIAAGLVGATGLAQLAVIKKTQFTPAKLAKGGQIPFDTGGVIQGNSHANGGVPFVAGGQMMEAEGGELVVNKNIWSRPDFVNSISAMNAATGGVRFAEGGVIPTRFTPSGQSITTAALTKSSEDVSALIPILSNIQVTNNVVDTTSNQSTLINITNNSTLQ